MQDDPPLNTAAKPDEAEILRLYRALSPRAQTNLIQLLTITAEEKGAIHDGDVMLMQEYIHANYTR